MTCGIQEKRLARDKGSKVDDMADKRTGTADTRDTQQTNMASPVYIAALKHTKISFSKPGAASYRLSLKSGNVCSQATSITLPILNPY